ncbi:MAG: gliding motility-associated C-terminal domain-containing protein [Muribaculaceae bacterium]
MNKIAKRIYVAVAAMLLAMAAYGGEVKFVGDGNHAVISEKPSSSTGLECVYVVYDTGSVKMQYVASSSQATVTWYSFGASGAAYAQTITGVVKDGSTYTLDNVIANSGYVIEEGTNRHYLWVINYADYRLNLRGIDPAQEADCNTTTLLVDGEGRDMTYYTINGGLKKLDRGIELTYMSLEWNSELTEWQQVEQQRQLSEFKQTVSVEAVLCNTQFTMTGDRFLKQWGEAQSVVSDEFTATAVAVNAVAIQEPNDADNMTGKTDSEDVLGGSAPANISFIAYVTDAVTHGEWQMCSNSEFEEIEERYAETELNKTINDAGTSYWRFVATNANSGCEATSDMFVVNIGESSLQCPNAFSPGVTEGINDEWKVSFRSIVKFKCFIFNSWGVKMCELNDPAQGWDGRYKGKLVKPGVYYYVIEAEGSEGKKYKLKGDINIVGMKGDGSSSNISDSDNSSEQE